MRIRTQILIVRGRTLRIGDRARPWRVPGIAGYELGGWAGDQRCPRENGFLRQGRGLFVRIFMEI
jgi:hypothetical protein